MSGGEIAGIVIGVLAFLAIVGFVIHLSERNKKKKAAERQRQQAQRQAAGAAAASLNAARAETDRVEAIRLARERNEEESAAQQVCNFVPAGSQVHVAPLESAYMYMYVYLNSLLFCVVNIRAKNFRVK